MRDPSKMYADRVPDEPYLPGPGTDTEMAQNVPADHVEHSHRGTGRLSGREALVTGGRPSAGGHLRLPRQRQVVVRRGATLHVDGGMPTS